MRREVLNVYISKGKITRASLLLAALPLFFMIYFMGLNPLYSIIILFILGGSIIFLSKEECAGKAIFSPWHTFPIFYMLMYGIGSIRWIIEGSEGVNKGVLLICLGLVSYFIGTLLVARPRSYSSPPLINDMVFVRISAILLFAIGLVFAIFFYYRAGIPVLLEDKLDGRIVAIQKGGNNILFLARLVVPAFILYFIYFFLKNSYINSQKSIDKIVLFLMFLLCFFVMIGTAGRSDLFFLLFMMMVSYYHVSERVRTKTIIILGSLLFFVVFLYGFIRVIGAEPERLAVYGLFSEGLGIGSNIVSMFIIYLIFQLSVYTGNFLIILKVFPSEIDFLYGGNFFITLNTLLPGKQQTIGEIVKDVIGIEFKGGGVNPTMLGELYLDLGVSYLVIVMFLYGIVYTSVFNWYLKTRNLSSTYIYSYLTFVMVISVLGGLFSQLSRWYFLVVILLLILVTSKSTYRWMKE